MLHLKNIARTIDRHTVLTDVTLRVEKGERVAVLGPSGSGKTSLLRLIMGLDLLDGGEIRYGDRLLARAGENRVPPEKRGFSLVFEKSTLMPFMNVEENILVGGKTGDPSKEQRLEILLELLSLAPLRKRPSHALSAGEQQRVALARSLFVAPELLLLDEPFRNIDRAFRDAFIPALTDYLDTQGSAAVLVTHDRDEAFSFSQRMAVLHRGRIVASDTPRVLYTHPAGERDAALLGECNTLPSDVALDVLGVSEGDPEAARYLVRPEQLAVSDEKPHNATLREVRFLGFYTTLVFDVKAPVPLLVTVITDAPFEVNRPYRVRLKPGARVTALGARPSEKEEALP